MPQATVMTQSDSLSWCLFYRKTAHKRLFRARP